MQLWTYHPKDLQVDDPNLCIDPLLGLDCKFPDEERRNHYQKVLAKFQQLVGTDQILWCTLREGRTSMRRTGISNGNWMFPTIRRR